MHRIQCSNWLFHVQVSYLYYKIIQSDHLIHWIVFRLAISSNSIEIALASFTTVRPGQIIMEDINKR
jgi:hypothetical protein